MNDKNNKWLIAIVIISLLLNILVVSIGLKWAVVGQTSDLVSVPTLDKGKSYQVVIPNKGITCIDVENQLGLKRGDVVSITNDQITGVTIQFNKDVALTSTQVKTATDTIKGLVPIITAK